MSRMKKNIGMKLLVFLSMVILLISTGCASNRNKMASDMPGLPQVSSFADDIKDITLPSELVWDRKNSMAIKTESFRGGVFNYRGRVEVMSLKDYLVASMQDNKWRLVGETASKNIMLAFVKPNKTCMMVIAEGLFGKTDLALYVAIDKTAAAGMNPFGETISQ
jgi:hypothetical protein